MATLDLKSGEVDIELNGDIRTLKPTLRAASSVSRQYGGFTEAMNKILAFDLDAFHFVVTAGLGVKDAKESTALAEQVFAAGVKELRPHLLRYLGMLANGGKAIEDVADDEKKDDAKNETAAA